tara:strand:+ start:40 stop:1416 length:1377 start_codon:yes stop_codon:yes gene_type:complete
MSVASIAKSRAMILLGCAAVGVAVWVYCDGGVGDVAPPSGSGALVEREQRPDVEPVRSTPDETTNYRQAVLCGEQDEPLADGFWRARVFVVDALGAPVDHARVDLSAGQKTRVLTTAYTDVAGAATLLASGERAFVRAYHRDIGRSLAVDVVEERGVETSLMLARPAKMTGVVVGDRFQPIAGQLVRLIDAAHGLFPGSLTVAPSEVVTDVHGRFEFEALVGVRVIMGSDPRNAFVAEDGVEVTASSHERDVESVDDALEWHSQVKWGVEQAERVGGRHVQTRRLTAAQMEPFWIEVTMPGGAPATWVGLHWILPGRTPDQFYAQARDRHRYRMHTCEVKRKPARMLVRGRNGYAATLAFDEGLLPTSVGVVLQPPGDIEIQVLHHGQRARGVHTQLMSWGKLAKAHLDSDGYARYTMVHHGPMEVHVMRGPELLATREVHVPSGGTGRAIVHVDLSR